MFTIKFYNEPDEYNVVSAPHYDVRKVSSERDGDVFIISVYKDYTTLNGVEYRVALDLPVMHWKYCFIENSSGKTIDHIRP